MRQTELKKNWSINSGAFRGLLDWLDEGGNSDGQNYLKMRERLVAYFDRKNCLMPDDLADETLNRVARKLEENVTIETETPAKFCYITARFVFLEQLRGADKKSVPLGDFDGRQITAPDEDEENDAKERTLNCLERCVGVLETANREIINNYYHGEEREKIENRRNIAKNLGISTNALTIRACRIREKLEVCVKKCVGEG